MAEERKIAGTNEVYTGMVLKLGEFEYTTVGGGVEGDRQQLEPMDTTGEFLDGTLPPGTSDTVNDNSPITNFQYLEDYDIGTSDGILNVVDANYWNQNGRADIAQQIVGFIASGNYPPNRPTQGGQADMGTNQQNQQGSGMNGNGGNTGGGPSY